MRRIPLFLSLLAIALLAWATTAHASAGPQPTSSSPAAGEELHEAPAEVSITFDQPLDPSSLMKVEDECGHRVDDRGVIVGTTEMRVGITETPAGVYKVVYAAKGVAGVTGTTLGEFQFEVMHGEACGASVRDHQHHGGTGGMDGHEHEGHGTDHDETTHEHGSGEHAHSSSGEEHGGEHGHEHESGEEPNPGATFAAPVETQPPIADAAPVAAFPIPEAGSDTVLAALAIAVLIGVLGGWLLRRLPATN